MKGKYKAVFLIPADAEKVLGDNGWEFKTKTRLPDDIENILKDALTLKHLEEYLGVTDYVDENKTMKVSVLRDDEGRIEHIYFKLYEKTVDDLLLMYKSSSISKGSELFVP